MKRAAAKPKSGRHDMRGARVRTPAATPEKKELPWGASSVVERADSVEYLLSVEAFWSALCPAPWTRTVFTYPPRPGPPVCLADARSIGRNYGFIFRHTYAPLWNRPDVPDGKAVVLICDEHVAAPSSNELLRSRLRVRLDECRSLVACCERAATQLERDDECLAATALRALAHELSQVAP
jgi:hypothetical protein